MRRRNPGGRWKDRRGETGSALFLCLLLSATAAALVSTFLGRALVEQNRTQGRSARERAYWRAVGEVEEAKHILSHSPFTSGSNDAIQEALASDPPFVPGTSVLLEPAGPNRWYRLIGMVRYAGELGTVVTFVRDGTSYVSYSYYVENDALGVSGTTEGRVHSNSQVEIHFPEATFDGLVSAAGGFSYHHGATPANTHFLGNADPMAEARGLLSNVSFEQIRAAASFEAPDAVDAVVRFLGDTVQVELYEKQIQILVPVPGTEDEVTGIVLDPDSNQWSPQSAPQPSTTYETQTIGGELLSTQTFPADGIFFFPDRVISLSGDLTGHVTIVSEGSVLITDSLRYRDANGEYALRNGTDPSQAYLQNPSFDRDHSLGVIARGDIRYSRDVPASLEVNAALVSTEGTVSFEGVVVDTPGELAVDGTASIKDTLRRFGSVLCFHRPVAAVLDADGSVAHGFHDGQARYDAALLSRPPPGFPEEPRVSFNFGYRFDRTGLPDAGHGLLLGETVPLTDLELIDAVQDVILENKDLGRTWDDDVVGSLLGGVGQVLGGVGGLLGGG